MIMIKAIVRPEKVSEVLNKLYENDFRAVTKISVLGRGKQRGLKSGDVTYDEIPKEMLMIVVEDNQQEKVEKIIIEAAKTNKTGAYGDGKIFSYPVSKAITISSSKEGL